MDSVTLFPGLNTVLWQYGQQDSSSGTPVYVDNAQIAVTLVDQNGASLGPYSYTFVSGPQTAPDGTVYPDGNYRAIIPYNAAIGASSLYLGTISVTIGGVIQTEQFQAASYLATAVGYYTTQAKIETRYGKINSDLYADTEDANSTAVILPHFQEVLGAVDVILDRELRIYGYSRPADVTTSNDFHILQDLATDIGIAILYRSRGIYDDGVKTLDSRFRVMIEEAKGRLWRALQQGIDFPRKTKSLSGEQMAGVDYQPKAGEPIQGMETGTSFPFAGPYLWTFVGWW